MFAPPMRLPGPKITRKSHPQTSWPSGMVQPKDQTQRFLLQTCFSLTHGKLLPPSGFSHHQLSQSPHILVLDGTQVPLAISLPTECHKVPGNSSCCRTSIPTMLPGFPSQEEYKIVQSACHAKAPCQGSQSFLLIP